MYVIATPALTNKGAINTIKGNLIITEDMMYSKANKLMDHKNNIPAILSLTV